jgi:predicted  nucleic acid-binding Zn-ribbon protein
MTDAEREPLSPSLAQTVDGIYAVCQNCGHKLQKLFGIGVIEYGYFPKFCPECGRAVKRD